MKVLLTEGTTTSARQAIYALAPLGVTIDVCDPQPLTTQIVGSRLVRRCYRCPSYVQDPIAFLAFLTGHLRKHVYDVLLPTHDEIYALARWRDELARFVRHAIPEFASLRLLQSKADFARLLTRLQLPGPPTIVGRQRAHLRPPWPGPYFLKLEFATAGRGVWYAEDERALSWQLDRLEQDNVLNGEQDVLLQQRAPGTLRVVQGLFQHGRLVAAHCYQSLAAGVGGSPRARIGVSDPQAINHIERIGGALRWHGAMFIDYLYDESTGPWYIDANPRLGETMNALRSGVNLPSSLLQIARDEPIANCTIGHPGVRTHGAITAVLHAALQGESRTQIVAEMFRALLGRGVYAGSSDELTRPCDDPSSVLPLAALCVRLLWNPKSAERLVQRAVAKYALTDTVVRMVAASE